MFCDNLQLQRSKMEFMCPLNLHLLLFSLVFTASPPLETGYFLSHKVPDSAVGRFQRIFSSLLGSRSLPFLIIILSSNTSMVIISGSQTAPGDWTPLGHWPSLPSLLWAPYAWGRSTWASNRMWQWEEKPGECTGEEAMGTGTRQSNSHGEGSYHGGGIGGICQGPAEEVKGEGEARDDADVEPRPPRTRRQMLWKGFLQQKLASVTLRIQSHTRILRL